MNEANARELRSLPVEDAIRYWDEAEKLGKRKGKLRDLSYVWIARHGLFGRT